MAESVDIMTCLDILFFVVLYFRTFILCGTVRKLCIIWNIRRSFPWKVKREYIFPRWEQKGLFCNEFFIFKETADAGRDP